MPTPRDQIVVKLPLSLSSRQAALLVARAQARHLSLEELLSDMVDREIGDPPRLTPLSPYSDMTAEDLEPEPGEDVDGEPDPLPVEPDDGLDMVRAAQQDAQWDYDVVRFRRGGLRLVAEEAGRV